MSEPQLAVRFTPDRTGRTYLSQQRATHPYHLCRPLYRPGDPAGLSTLYVQGCAGGLFEGDRVSSRVRVDARAAAHLTTGASTIVHRMPNGGHAEQAVELEVGAGALLEYCPDPLILFPASRLSNRLTIRLAATARVIALEGILSHGLPDDPGPFDWLDNRLRVERDGGELIARERNLLRGARWRERSAGLTGAYDCQGSLIVLGAGDAPLLPLRAALSGRADLLAGASPLPEAAGVFVRLLAREPVALRAGLQCAWQAARSALGIAAGATRPK